ncbi:MAG: class A beta-lactamase-related serine hydrolase [Candidatus Omnitrophica bacterium]|nr:class A beta-lactamase-related serine hydrolase [Candidatus Omnitrophota bacterium]
MPIIYRRLSKLEGIKYSIGEYIRRCQENGDVSNVSVYMKDLNKGTWIGLDEDSNFSAASLLKVPLMIAYLKMAEQDPAILNQQIKYGQALNSTPQNILPENRAQLGNTYTVDQLLRNMIVYSDNISKELLWGNIDHKFIASVYSDLGLAAMDLTESEPQISAKDYAAFFRVLYNVTYLNANLSEKAMKLLSQADFHDGIVAGLPKNIVVAHKFAERKYAAEAYLPGSVQLHDCGIVYYPKKPYLICIMTKGRNLDALKEIIKDISKIAYEYEEKTMDLL